MIRKVPYRFTKNLDDPWRAGLCDATATRPNDNPYREGSAEHAIYEKAYALGRKHMDADAAKAGRERMQWKSRKPRRQYARFLKAEKRARERERREET